VDVPSALGAELHRLTQSLDDPSVDVAHTLHRLAADARSAVASYLGLSMTVQTDGSPDVTLTLMEDVGRDRIRASLAVPLASENGGGTVGFLILCAGQPGAFVDMAADLSWLTGVPLADLMCDQHLDLSERPMNLGSWQAASVVNQAIGVLIGRGSTPAQAREILAAGTEAGGCDQYTVAARILASLADGEPAS
jgi:hypothetical protein